MSGGGRQHEGDDTATQAKPARTRCNAAIRGAQGGGGDAYLERMSLTPTGIAWRRVVVVDGWAGGRMGGRREVELSRGWVMASTSGGSRLAEVWGGRRRVVRRRRGGDGGSRQAGVVCVER